MLRDEEIEKPKYQSKNPDPPKKDKSLIILRSITLFLHIVLIILYVAQGQWFLAGLWTFVGLLTAFLLCWDIQRYNA